MIILINGSINSGKTSVAKVITAVLPQTAHVEIDSLREFISWMPLEASIPINLENAVSVIHTFVKYGLNVVMTYPLSQENYTYLSSELSSLETPIHFFTLCPPLEIALSDRGERILSSWEKERINFHYASGITKPSFGYVLDNSKESAAQTAKGFLTKLVFDGLARHDFYFLCVRVLSMSIIRDS